MTTPHLSLDHGDHGVLHLRLRRPEARNALTPEMVAGIPELLAEAAALPAEACRLLALRGDGPVFCAGADIRAMRESGRAGEEANLADARGFASLFRSVASFPAPVIAGVQGAAIGGGFGLAVAADLVVAEENARFGTPEARLGLTPAVISPYVVRRLGPGAAGPFLLGGSMAAGAEAQRLGIAHELAPPGDLDRAVARAARRFLECAPNAVRKTKELILRESPLPPPEIEEATIRTIAAARASEEGQAGAAAFFARKPPPWAPPAEPKDADEGGS